MPPNTMTSGPGERLFHVKVLASWPPFVHASKAPSRRRRPWPSRRTMMTPTSAAARPGVQHRRALAVRALALGVEEVARARDDAAEDRLDLHGARAVHHLDLGAGAAVAAAAGRRPRAGRRSGPARAPAEAARTAPAAARTGSRGGANPPGGGAMPRLVFCRRAARGRGRRRQRCLRVEERDVHAAVAEHDLVARLEARLADALPVDERPARRAEVDDVNLVGPGDLDDGVHARHRLVVDPQVRRGELARP